MTYVFQPVILSGDQLIHSLYLQCLASLSVGLSLDKALCFSPQPLHHYTQETGRINLGENSCMIWVPRTHDIFANFVHIHLPNHPLRPRCTVQLKFPHPKITDKMGMSFADPFLVMVICASSCVLCFENMLVVSLNLRISLVMAFGILRRGNVFGFEQCARGDTDCSCINKEFVG